MNKDLETYEYVARRTVSGSVLSVAVKANVLLAMSTPMDDDSESDLSNVLASGGAAFTKHYLT